MPETSSRGLDCPWNGMGKCGPRCAWYDRVLETCCVRAINDHLRSMYAGDLWHRILGDMGGRDVLATPNDDSYPCPICGGKGWHVETEGDVSKVIRCQH